MNYETTRKGMTLKVCILDLLAADGQVGKLEIGHTGAEMLPADETDRWTLHGVEPSISALLLGMSFTGPVVATGWFAGKPIRRRFEGCRFQLGKWDKGVAIVDTSMEAEAG